MVNRISADVVVVGARCAGSSVAMLLARRGHQVLLVDQETFPSDMKLSTHLIWHAGVDMLQRWGILARLEEAGTPILREFSLDLGEIVLRGRPPGTVANAAIAPKRIVLDQALLDAAVEAGATFRAGVTFEDVLRDDAGRVTGITCIDRDGAPLEVHARAVIGADGRTSKVARAVGSAPYHEFPREKCTINVFAYYSGVALDGVEFYSRPERMAYAWGTNDGQIMTGIILPGRRERTRGDALEAEVFEEMEAMAPKLAARLRGGRRESEWLRVCIPTGCRVPAGGGWALVGDASLTFDPITAAGITNAFRDAEHLADALHGAFGGAGSVDEALADYAAKRDASAVHWHLFAQQMAELAPPTDDLIRILVALGKDQTQTDRYFGLFGQTVLPSDFFGPENIGRLLGGAAQPGA